MATFVRGGVAYEISPHVRVAAGANWSRSYPCGEIISAYRGIPPNARLAHRGSLLEHVIFMSNGIDVERNHTMTFALSYSATHSGPVGGSTPSR